MTQEDKLISRIGEMMDEKLSVFGGRFDGIDKRFDGIDMRLDKMDNRFDKMDDRFDRMDSRFDKMDGRFDEMDNRFGKMDGRFDENDGRHDNTESLMATMIATQDKIVSKIIDMDTYLHEKVATKDELQNVKSELMNHIDSFAKRQDIFDHELVSARSRMTRIEESR